MTREFIVQFNKKCLELIGCEIKHNVVDWTEHNDLSLTEYWNNDKKSFTHTPKGQGVAWYRVKHRDGFYQLYTDFTFSKINESDIELSVKHNGEYKLLENMEFHSDWNCIMEVLTNIKVLVCESEFNYRFMNSLLSFEKEVIVKAIDEFINWYNQNK